MSVLFSFFSILSMVFLKRWWAVNKTTSTVGICPTILKEVMRYFYLERKNVNIRSSSRLQYVNQLFPQKIIPLFTLLFFTHVKLSLWWGPVAERTVSTVLKFGYYMEMEANRLLAQILIVLYHLHIFCPLLAFIDSREIGELIERDGEDMQQRAGSWSWTSCGKDIQVLYTLFIHRYLVPQLYIQLEDNLYCRTSHTSASFLLTQVQNYGAA